MPCSGLIPDPKIEKRKSSCLPSPSSEDSIPLTTRLCDLPGHRGDGHSRITSLTLSASGEYFSCLGGSEKSSFSSILLEEVERGLDLKGTEKGTVSSLKGIIMHAIYPTKIISGQTDGEIIMEQKR